MEVVVNTLHVILTGNKNGNLCLGRVRLILAKKIMDIHSTIRGRQALNEHPSIPGLSCALPELTKKMNRKRPIYLHLSKKMSISVRRKQEVKKAKKTEPPAEANDPVS